HRFAPSAQLNAFLRHLLRNGDRIFLHFYSFCATIQSNLHQKGEGRLFASSFYLYSKFAYSDKDLKLDFHNLFELET
ncbi:hypothetical protein, partial [Helicobacter typhlonius]|uniref:hypothetical protein n=1 Tax=Helicobacter typhlonius TaxID=76936 RepID=UPI002FE387D7